MRKTKIDISEHLSTFVTEHKVELFNKIIQNRTRYMTVVLEDIYQPHNASAVLRTCDCFGIQDVHIIENKNEYTVNPGVALGASKWLNLKKYNSLENNTLETINTLKKQGYRIVATTPHTNDVKLEDFDIQKGKFALFMGAEMRGLSNIVLDNADEFLKIPMFGFTESFNISVSASIILHYLRMELNKSEIQWQLNKEDKENVLLDWYKATIKTSDEIISRFENGNLET